MTIHDAVPFDHPEWLNKKFSAWYRFVLPRVARSAHKIITISNFSKERILNNMDVKEENIHVIYNGVDHRFFDVNNNKDYNPCFIPFSRYILSVGSLEPRKNLNRLLTAWNNINARVDEDIGLVVVGGLGAQRVFSNSEFNQIPDRVFFTGHVLDTFLPSVYANALAFVYPSIYEGFGLPPLEAMATGVPVITSCTTALPEVVGDAALMVDPLDVVDLSGAMLAIISDSVLRRSLIEKGNIQARKFSWDRAADETLALLHST